MEYENFSWKARGRSFKYALNGIKLLLRQHNAWLHSAVTVLVIPAGIILHINTVSWIAIILCIGAVLMAEAFNTAIEKVCDKVSPEKHPLIGEAKDIAAGAVLIMAIASATVGLIIFIPAIIDFIPELTALFK